MLLTLSKDLDIVLQGCNLLGQSRNLVTHFLIGSHGIVYCLTYVILHGILGGSLILVCRKRTNKPISLWRHECQSDGRDVKINRWKIQPPK
jgi:hypothetical protein